MKKILCVYATRQIDSNLFMASTVFRGLKEAGYETDMVFAGTNKVISDFKSNYEYWFGKVVYIPIPDSGLKKICDKHSVTRLGYSFYRHFVADGFCHLATTAIKKELGNRAYDCILSFIPPIISGRLAIEIRKRLGLESRKLIQFWTDPLSLGRCDSIDDIPWTRFVHKWQERRLLKQADKVVFCYPLLCESEQKLHPAYAHKMHWSDVSYVNHDNNIRPANTIPIIGLFGAYQSHVRNIKPLLDAIKGLPKYKFIIRGDGDLPYDVSGIPNLDIEHGRKPVSEIERLEASCDILLSLGGLSGLTHPAGKTFYYADYNKPIVHISDGKNALYFENYLNGFESRYIHCYNISEDIIKAVHEAVNELADFKLHIPERMNASVIARKIIED